METQEKALLLYLKAHKRITPIEALQELGIFRLSARVFNLSKEGIEIITNRITENNKTFAEYVLVSET